MNDPFQFVWSLVQFQPMALALIAALITGYILKLVPSYPNGRIPVVVIVISSLVYLVLCVPPKDMDGDERARYLVSTIILGLAIGLFAWLFHAQLLKRFEQKIPFLGPALQNAENKNNPP